MELNRKEGIVNGIDIPLPDELKEWLNKLMNMFSFDDVECHYVSGSSFKEVPHVGTIMIPHEDNKTFSMVQSDDGIDVDKKAMINAMLRFVKYKNSYPTLMLFSGEFISMEEPIDHAGMAAAMDMAVAHDKIYRSETERIYDGMVK